jgi:hypothetical protein
MTLSPHGARKHVEVIGEQVRCADNGLVLVDVSDDVVDLGCVVPETLQGTGHGLVDDLHVATAYQLLELHEAKVRFDTGGVAIHQQADRSCWCEHRGLSVTRAVHR